MASQRLQVQGELLLQAPHCGCDGQFRGVRPRLRVRRGAVCEHLPMARRPPTAWQLRGAPAILPEHQAAGAEVAEPDVHRSVQQPPLQADVQRPRRGEGHACSETQGVNCSRESRGGNGALVGSCGRRWSFWWGADPSTSHDPQLARASGRERFNRERSAAAAILTPTTGRGVENGHKRTTQPSTIRTVGERCGPLRLRRSETPPSVQPDSPRAPPDHFAPTNLPHAAPARRKHR